MENEVIVYSTACCAPCESLKNFLKEEGVKFKVKDIMMDEEAAEFMYKKGVRSAPALTIGGKIIFGSALSTDNLRKVLNL